MVTRVLDTSVVVKWFLEEEGTDRADLFLQELAQNTARAVVPSSLLSEIANVFWVHRREGLTEAEAQGFWGELVQLPLEIIEVTHQLLFDALAFSFRMQVSPYDATFVVLARRLECDLITADGVLWRKVRETCPWVKLL
jgi:predicted nucleic acid-binding protein